jgi:hypothetical protein
MIHWGTLSERLSPAGIFNFDGSIVSGTSNTTVGKRSATAVAQGLCYQREPLFSKVFPGTEMGVCQYKYVNGIDTLNAFALIMAPS